MGGRNPEAAGRMALEALAHTGQRGILAAGWGGLTVGNVPPTVYLLEAIPHAWLFPQLAAIVHHGGAGTTAAALRAGVPSIVVPFMGDQAFWGRRVAALGVGPAPMARKSLRSTQLSQAIDRVLRDTAMHQRAAALGQQAPLRRGANAVCRAWKRSGCCWLNTPGIAIMGCAPALRWSSRQHWMGCAMQGLRTRSMRESNRSQLGYRIGLENTQWPPCIAWLGFPDLEKPPSPE